MSMGLVFTLLGTIYIVIGGLGIEVFNGYTFREVQETGLIVMLFGCLMLTIEKAADRIIKALKGGK